METLFLLSTYTLLSPLCPTIVCMIRTSHWPTNSVFATQHPAQLCYQLPAPDTGDPQQQMAVGNRGEGRSGRRLERWRGKVKIATSCLKISSSWFLLSIHTCTHAHAQQYFTVSMLASALSPCYVFSPWSWILPLDSCVRAVHLILMKEVKVTLRKWLPSTGAGMLQRHLQPKYLTGTWFLVLEGCRKLQSFKDHFYLRSSSPLVLHSQIQTEVTVMPGTNRWECVTLSTNTMWFLVRRRDEDVLSLSCRQLPRLWRVVALSWVWSCPSQCAGSDR